MYIALGVSLIATKGWGVPEVGETYTYARQLCQHLEDPYQLFPVLRGLLSYYHIRAEFRTAQALGEQLLALAQQALDAALLVVAHASLGMTLLALGAVATAHTHFTQGITLYDSQRYRASAFLYRDDAGMICHSLAARALWILGYPDQALARNHAMVTLAQQRVHPLSLCYVLSSAAIFHSFRREVRCTQERAEATIRLAQEQGFPHWMAVGAIQHGWARVQQGQAREGIAQLNEGLGAFRATGAQTLQSYFLALLAEAHGTMGQPEAGLTVLTEALMYVDTTGERWYEPELYRLKGELLLQQSLDNHFEAEACFHHALDLARNQQAKSFELRTATSLARLWQQHGNRQEAYDLLAPVYNWFTEGFDTADLQEAKALLHELEDGR
jgi:predicted ATPase